MKEAALAVVLVVVVAACGGSDDELGGIEEQIVENIIEQASEEGVDLDIDSDDDSMTVTFDDEDGEGAVTFGGGLPDDFPFPLPDEYEVGTSMEFEQDAGTQYSAVVHTAPEDFDDLAVMYESWMEDEGFEVDKNTIEGDGTKVIFLNGVRDDVGVAISMSLNEVANDDDGNLIYETAISLSWTPTG